MKRDIKKTTGRKPGSLIHLGEKKLDKVRIRVIDFDENELNINEYETIEETYKYKYNNNVSWINIDGLHDIDVIKKIGGHFEINNLVLEDILDTYQQPKLENHGEFIFITLKMIYYDEEDNTLTYEQFSFLIFSNLLISFQERIGDVFKSVRSRISKKIGNVRKSGVDYLTYALLDAIVDNYYLVVDKIKERIDILENMIIEDQDQKVLKDIYNLKKEILILDRYVRPSKEVIGKLEVLESALVKKETFNYINDLHDHITDVSETLHLYRDMTSGLIDTFLNISGNKMNEVMKVLTIMASIFIPLTFIAGIYGMNFESMPELQKSWGYPVALVVMAVVACIMLIYFKRKKWF